MGLFMDFLKGSGQGMHQGCTSERIDADEDFCAVGFGKNVLAKDGIRCAAGGGAVFTVEQ